MKWIAASLVTAAMMASTAHAETFTYSIEFGQPEFFGGVGPEDNTSWRGGVVEGPYSSTSSTGESGTGNVRCVGMDQPEASIFALHLACTAAAAENAGTSSIIYGCNELQDDRGWSCVGYMEGKSGPRSGQNGTLTMHLKQGSSVGTGQWYE